MKIILETAPATLSVPLVDGRTLAAEDDAFEGCPERPLGDAALDRKVVSLIGEPLADLQRRLFATLRPREHDSGAVQRPHAELTPLPR